MGLEETKTNGLQGEPPQFLRVDAFRHLKGITQRELKYDACLQLIPLRLH